MIYIYIYIIHIYIYIYYSNARNRYVVARNGISTQQEDEMLIFLIQNADTSRIYEIFLSQTLLLEHADVEC